MSQSKRGSMLEALANTMSGFLLSMLVNYFTLPWFGFNVRWDQSLWITVIFTVVSVVRSYVWRRLFNWWTYRPLKLCPHGTPDDYFCSLCERDK